MDIKQILSYCDHTLLSTQATEEEILAIYQDGIKFGCASVCIPPCYVPFLKKQNDLLPKGQRKLPICTVIGFPNGYNTKECKAFEASDAVEKGADEIDMVINVCDVKNGKYDKILDEIKTVKEACHGKLLKVIIEICLLTDDEMIKMCEVVSQSGADFIKTSTGFSKHGATFHSVELMAKYSQPHLRIKAAGGISSLDDAEKYIELGATRLGTSRIVKIAKELLNGDKGDNKDGNTSY